jgi:hypothetical protein
MELVADNTWQIVVTFDGQADQRFKFDVTGDWSLNYGDGILDSDAGDIYTSVVGIPVIFEDACFLQFKRSCYRS